MRHGAWGVALLVCVGLASSPAWTGGFVYDDWGTARSGKQDGLDDLLAVFERDSSDYIENRNGRWPFGVTYRPLSMLSLIAVQATRPAPWLHHLVSLALHAVCVLGLYLALRRMRGRTSFDVESALLSAAFALHPVTIEAYGWINGRSDVLAGAFLMGLACQLPFRAEASPWRNLVGVAVCAAGAALSKEPAVVACLSLLALPLLPPRGGLAWARLRAAAPASCAGLCGLCVALGARAVVVRGHPSGAGALLSDRELPAAYAGALRLAIEHVLLPLPRAMLSLAFELTTPRTALDFALLAAVLLGLVALVRRRRLRTLCLVAGALACILPVLGVRHMFWLGFDRYLYIPLLLLTLAAGTSLDPARSEASSRPLTRGLVFAALTALGVSSFVTARGYHSQEAWLHSLMHSRPDDPSGWAMAADWYARENDSKRARAYALGAPREGVPPPISHDLAELMIALGERRAAVQLMEQTYRAFPERAPARFDALVARGMQGRFDEAYALARSLQSDALFCTAARDWIADWLNQPDLPAAERPRVQKLVASLRCSGGI